MELVENRNPLEVFIENLSGIMLDKEIPMTEDKDLLLLCLKNENLAGLGNLIKLAHKIFNHRANPRLVTLLSCKENHCAECVRDFFEAKCCNHNRNITHSE